MIASVLQKFRTLWRYVFPTAEDRAYLAEIRAADAFDADYYRTATPNLMRIFKIWPDRHYIQMGERNGLCPNPRFSPRAYVFNNPDVADQPLPPLRHYIAQGRAEGRVVLAPLGHATPTQAELPQITDADRPDPPARVAVLLHVYYGDFWAEMAPLLAAQSFDFDLFVTLTQSPESPALETDIKARFPRARVWQMPNHGRDIFPFVHLVNAGVFAPYRAVCKLHSKKSPHRADGNDWRRALIAGVLGDPVQTAARLERFISDPKLGFWVSQGQLYTNETWWGANRDRTQALMARAGIAPGTPLHFPAGSIYWIKQGLITRLAALGLEAADFEPEQALVDGTTAHAVERLLGMMAQDAGVRIVEAPAL